MRTTRHVASTASTPTGPRSTSTTTSGCTSAIPGLSCCASRPAASCAPSCARTDTRRHIHTPRHPKVASIAAPHTPRDQASPLQTQLSPHERLKLCGPARHATRHPQATHRPLPQWFDLQKPDVRPSFLHCLQSARPLRVHHQNREYSCTSPPCRLQWCLIQYADDAPCRLHRLHCCRPSLDQYHHLRLYFRHTRPVLLRCATRRFLCSFLCPHRHTLSQLLTPHQE